jgi:hypothetical protein
MMRRFGAVFMVVAAGAVLAVAPADAFQCPKLVAQINNETGNRLDNASYEAKELGAQAAKLHAEGKHAEAEKAAKEGLAKLGLQSK